MKFAAMVANRDVFSGRNGVRTEAVARLFVIIVAHVAVIEHPTCVFCSARLVNKATDCVLLTIPESANATFFLVLPPEFGIDMTVLVKRSDQIVTMAGRARGEFLGSRKLESDVLERVLRFHGDLPCC